MARLPRSAVRQFYVPSMNNKVDNLYNSIKNQKKKPLQKRNCQRIRINIGSMDSNTYQDQIIESFTLRTSAIVKPKTTGDPYKKDDMKRPCPHKKEINTYLASLPVPKGAKTLVLDAHKAMTTRELLKNDNIATVDIVNKEEDVADILEKKFKKNKRVNVHSSDAYDFVVQTDNTQYDIQYYDMCGMFYGNTTKSHAIAKHVTDNNMVAPGGYLAFTMYNGRTSTDQTQACLDFMKSTGFELVKSWKYGKQMSTLVFKKPEANSVTESMDFDKEHLSTFLKIVGQMVQNGCPKKKALEMVRDYIKYHK